MASLYEIPIENINGIGTKRGQLYRRLDIDTVGALVRFYPRTYEDWSKITLISQTTPGETFCIKARLHTPAVERRIANGKLLVTAELSDGYSFLKLAFFNNKYIKSMLRTTEEYLFYGKVTSSGGTKEMINPTFAKVGEGNAIHPIYSQVAGLTTKQIEVSVKKALTMLPSQIKDTIPKHIREKYDLIGLKDALTKIHFPENADDISQARRRLIFEELLILVLGLNSMKALPSKKSLVGIEKDYTSEFLELLPFKLTNAQLKAVKDCVNDMIDNSKAMNRLVQGDVGSGKTMVAAAVCYTCVKNGWQAAVMAPTEILAQQHFQTFEGLFRDTGLRVALLTGSMTLKQKRLVLADLADGNIDIIVGTHSLISENVAFNRLGVVVTDEQHRFGVRQRSDLLAKGQNPHLLVMSATPIPRTLALIIYGDLDISVIDELPPGRQSVDTFLIDDSKRIRAYNFLIKNIESGRQCYIVCPAVENNDTGLTAVEEYAQEIQRTVFGNYSVAVLHGKMRAAEKDDVMNRFVSGEIDILVSTTVIEVGVNVPNSTIMMIENAERFGLSQLHQLRGRVGRGSDKSYCILVSNAKGEEARRRLKALCCTNDGFKIADEDLKMRGPGDFFGSRQHGLPELKIADLAENVNILHDAQSAAKELKNDYFDYENKDLGGLRAEVRMLFNNVGQQLN